MSVLEARELQKAFGGVRAAVPAKVLPPGPKVKPMTRLCPLGRVSICHGKPDGDAPLAVPLKVSCPTTITVAAAKAPTTMAPTIQIFFIDSQPWHAS